MALELLCGAVGLLGGERNEVGDVGEGERHGLEGHGRRDVFDAALARVVERALALEVLALRAALRTAHFVLLVTPAALLDVVEPQVRQHQDLHSDEDDLRTPREPFRVFSLSPSSSSKGRSSSEGGDDAQFNSRLAGENKTQDKRCKALGESLREKRRLAFVRGWGSRSRRRGL